MIKKSNLDVTLAVDVGTYKCAAAAIVNGDVRRIETPDGKTTESVYCKHEDDVLVGNAAVVRSSMYPDQLVRNPKKMIPELLGQEIGNTGLTPEQCQAAGLKMLIEAACRQHTEVAEAYDVGTLNLVLAVPASYAELDKKHLMTSLRDHGIEVTSFFTESSAPIFLCHHNNPGLFNDEQTVAVVDIGGGTLDISVFRFADGLPQEILSGRGNGSCGGVQATGLLFTWICLHFGLHELVHVYDEAHGRFDQSNCGLDTKALRSVHSVLESIERIKHELAAKSDVTVFIDAPNGDLVEITLTFDQYLAILEPFLLLCENSVREGLNESQLDWSQVDYCVAVGGPFMTPTLADRIKSVICIADDCFYHERDTHYAIPTGIIHGERLSHKISKATVEAIGIGVRDELTHQELVRRYILILG